MSPRTGNHGILAATPVGSTVRIAGVDGGLRVQSRLVGMGLIAGTCVDVRSNHGSGPVLIAAGHARIALGRGMAEKVRVVPVRGHPADETKDRQTA